MSETPRKPRCSRKHAASLPFRQAVGMNVYMRREDLGMTIEGLASGAGCSKAAVSAVESGRSAPSFGLLEKLAAALAVSPGTLLSRCGNDRRAR